MTEQVDPEKAIEAEFETTIEILEENADNEKFQLNLTEV